MNNPQTQHIFMMDHARRSAAYRGGDFKDWQEQARFKLGGELLGLNTFERCVDNLCIEWTREEEEYTEYRLLYNTEAHYQARAHLRIPKGVATPPVVICLQGHATGMHISLGQPKFPGDAETINGGDRDFARQIIARGQAALALEQRAFGECGGTEKGSDCYQPAMAALMIGRTLLGERVWDISRTIDLLEKYFDKQLDMSRVAVMGNSGGGTATIYAAALDERIAAAMPSCAFCGYKESIGVQNHCSCNYVPGIMHYFDMGDLVGLIAPRPLVIVNGQNDVIFPIESAKREYETAKILYKASGHAEMCRHVVGPEGHRFYAALGWPVFDELTGWKD